MSETADIVVIGAGIVGLATALEMQRRCPRARILVLEKERYPAIHQTGRNSGVIHAGVYYKPGSLKARFCREGAAETRAFCDEHGIAYEDCGKMIVATDDDEARRMADLGARARQNGIEIEDVDAAELRRREPNIQGVGALFSPATGIVDYGEMARRMAHLFAERGGHIETGRGVFGATPLGEGLRIDADRSPIHAQQAVVCAGLHSDRMVSAFGGTPGYRVIPFRGEYFRIRNQPDDLVRHLIYPVPDPERPFLGVHLTRKLDGGFTVGPNAVLALRREGYRFRDVSARDLAETLSYPGFWKMLWQNARPAADELAASAARRLYLRRVQRYCPRITLDDLHPYPAGVRAQAVAEDGAIVDDFLFVETPGALHVGNAPSPAATSALPIARHIADRLDAA